MRGFVKQWLAATVLLVVLFLILTHFTAFERDVRVIAQGYIGGVRALQGR